MTSPSISSNIISSTQITTPSPNFQDISHLDKVVYLFGHPISHSLSPLVQNTIYRALNKKWAYLLYESTDLPSFITMIKSHPKLLGAAVTMPFKVSIIPYLDELTPQAKAIGAVNTIFIKEAQEGRGKGGSGSDGEEKVFCGTNTDCIGIREAFRHCHPPSSLTISEDDVNSALGSSTATDSPTTTFQRNKKPALVVGGGGTCRAAIYTLQTWLSCSPIYIINRDPSEVATILSSCHARGFAQDILPIPSLSSAAQHSSLPPKLIVSAIPDFEPATDAEKTVRQILEYFLDSDSSSSDSNGLGRKKKKGALLEMCYHPSPETRIARLARGKGWEVIPGTEAMVWQGLEQVRLWSGIEVGDLVVEEGRRALEEGLRERDGG
ncbi:MAG: hypothetical protein Q9227_006211 [Pyrenula ochraceoflavens]